MVERVIGKPRDPDDWDDPAGEGDLTLFGAVEPVKAPNRLSSQTFDHDVYMGGPPPTPLCPDPLEVMRNWRESNAGSA